IRRLQLACFVVPIPLHETHEAPFVELGGFFLFRSFLPADELRGQLAHCVRGVRFDQPFFTRDPLLGGCVLQNLLQLLLGRLQALRYRADFLNPLAVSLRHIPISPDTRLCPSSHLFPLLWADVRSNNRTNNRTHGKQAETSSW